MSEEIDVVELKLAKNRKQEVAERLTGLPERLSPVTGFEDDTTYDLVTGLNDLRRGNLPALACIMGSIFQLKGQPYRLTDYFPFQPLFSPETPRQTVVVSGRQVSKSTCLAALSVAIGLSIPHFRILCLTPLFEQIRRFSQNYVRGLIEDSPVKSLFTEKVGSVRKGSNVSHNVLQHSFANGSILHYSYAFLTAERNRGISVDFNMYDEVQDLTYDFIPILRECMSASPWKRELFTGTPKSLDTTLAALHQDSSQAEWVTKCQHAGCGHWNVPAVEHDLWDMIGPFHDDISEKAPGVVCAKCRHPLQPRTGRWIHAYRERQFTFSGYHIPQIIMPMHYADKDAWAILLNKMAGHGNMTRSQFLNEVCGVASDEGAKLVTLTDIRNAACLPWDNDWRQSIKQCARYRHRVLAVDWGGGGGRIRGSGGDEKRLRSSFTTLAVLGIDAMGHIDVIWGYRSLRTHEYEWEARICLEAMARFRCSHLVHDYSNAGAAREVLIRQSGWPYERIVAMRYHAPAAKGAMTRHPPTLGLPRDWYSLDRSYTLMMTCQCIKSGIIRFFKDDYVSAEQPGVLRDFLALIEEKMDSRIGTDIFTIQRNPNMPDDFAHSVNYGACALWYLTRQWPDLAAAAKMRLSPEILNLLHPSHAVDWNAIQ